MAEILDHDTLPRDLWPSGIAKPTNDIATGPPTTIGVSVDSIAEATIIEKPLFRSTDTTRRTGIYLNTKGQQPVLVYFYGFVKCSNLQGTGNWRGNKLNAYRAKLTLELESGGCQNAFDPQIELARSAEVHAACQLHAPIADSHMSSTRLNFYHVVFKKIKRDEHVENNPLTRGLDPNGRAESLGPRWTFHDPPSFRRRLSDGTLLPCSTTSLQVGDFVRILARLDLVRFSDVKREEKVEVGLAMEDVVRLYTKSDLDAMHFTPNSTRSEIPPPDKQPTDISA